MEQSNCDRCGQVVFKAKTKGGHIEVNDTRNTTGDWYRPGHHEPHALTCPKRGKYQRAMNEMKRMLDL